MWAGIQLRCVLFAFLFSVCHSPVHAGDGRSLVFDAWRSGKKIGNHTLRFVQSGDRLTVDISIEFKGTVVFFPFSYSHRNHEVWEGNKLLELESHTVSNGKSNMLVAKSENGRLKLSVDGKASTIDQVFSTSWWNPATVKQKRLLNSQKGEVIDLVSESQSATIAPRANGTTIAVTEYRKSGTGNFNIAVAYDANGCLVGMSFKAPRDIARISYVLVARPSVAAARDLLENPLLKSCLDTASG
jgi:hypothetical protein